MTRRDFSTPALKATREGRSTSTKGRRSTRGGPEYRVGEVSQRRLTRLHRNYPVLADPYSMQHASDRPV